MPRAGAEHFDSIRLLRDTALNKVAGPNRTVTHIDRLVLGCDCGCGSTLAITSAAAE